MTPELGRGLAALTTGIYVLTVRDGATAHGMSSSWVTQVSGDPPLVLAAVDRRHATHALLERAGRFALNVVGHASRHLETYFHAHADGPLDNLTALAREDGRGGVPLLRDAMTSLVCTVVASHAAGDHTCFVARVDAVVERAPDRPLASHDLDYVYVGEVVRRG